MKIMILTNLFPPYTRGGAERIVELQADALAEAGHDVFVLTTRPDETMIENVRESGATVLRFKPRNLYYVLKDAGRPFWKRVLWHFVDLVSHQAEREVGSLIKDMNPDLIITHNLKGFGLTAFRAISRSGTSHVHILHDLQLVVPSGLKFFGKENSWMASGFLQKWYVRKVGQRLNNPTLVVSPSKYLLDEHLDAGLFSESKTKVLQNPAPWKDLVAKTDRVAETEKPLFVYVGQLEAHKGMNEIMDAWSDDLGAELAIVGTGMLEEKVSDWSGRTKTVTAYGRLSPTRVKGFMENATAVIVPSKCYENCPTVILESLTLGTPVIAARIGGIPELVGDRDGILITPGDSELLRAAIESVVADSGMWLARRSEIASNAARFHQEKYLKEFLRIISDL